VTLTNTPPDTRLRSAATEQPRLMSLLGRLRRTSGFGLLALVFGAILLLLFFYPLGIMVRQALFSSGHLSLAAVTSTLTDHEFLTSLRNTVILAVAVNVFTIPIAVAFAWLNERTDANMGRMSAILPVIPLLIPAISMAIGWVFLGDRRVGYLTHLLLVVLSWFGVHLTQAPLAIYSWYGLIFCYTLFAVPLAYIILSAAFRNLDPSLEEAARLYGRGAFSVFLKVSMPAIRYSIASAVLMVTIVTIGMFGIAQIIAEPAHVPLLSVYVYGLVNATYPPQLDKATVVGLLMIIVVLALWLAQQRFASKAAQARIGGMGVRAHRISLGKFRWVSRTAMIVYILLATILPLCALVLVALQPFWSPQIPWSKLGFSNFSSMFSQSGAVSALTNSLILGVVAATVAMIVAGILAVYADQIGGVRSKLVGGITKVPLAVPELVKAVGMLAAFGGAPFMLSGTLQLLMLAYVVAAIPFASIAAESALSQVGPQLVEASRIARASRARTFARILFPLMLPGLIAGWTLVFVIVIGDLNTASILSSPSNPVIGFYVLDIYSNGTWSELAAMTSVITLATVVIVGLVLALARPRYARKK
jgi:iron(III) transport system permease protein